MSEYIERDIVLQIAQISPSKQKLIERIKQTPTADVAPVVHGRWEYSGNGFKHLCANCKKGIEEEHIIPRSHTVTARIAARRWTEAKHERN